MSTTKECALLKFFHFFAAAHFIFALYYDWVYVLPEEIKLRRYSFGGKLVYLTVLNIILQILYFTLALINDFIGSNETGVKDLPRTRKLKDLFFSALAFPMALNVSILFWTLYLIDRNTVFPPELDAFFPSWLNHILHTSIAICILIELTLLHREYPTRKQGIFVLVTFMLCYLVWLFVIRYCAGRWVYPILEILNIPLKIAFFTFTIAIHPIAMYFLGEYLNQRIWSEEIKKIGLI